MGHHEIVFLLQPSQVLFWVMYGVLNKDEHKIIDQSLPHTVLSIPVSFFLLFLFQVYPYKQCCNMLPKKKILFNDSVFEQGMQIGLCGRGPMQITCNDDPSRRQLLEALLSLGRVETQESEESRIIRKSGYVVIEDITCKGAKRCRRFLVLIKHKLFVFRSAKGVWAPRFALSLYKSMV